MNASSVLIVAACLATQYSGHAAPDIVAPLNTGPGPIARSFLVAYSPQPSAGDETHDDDPLKARNIEDFTAHFTGGYLRSLNNHYNGMVEGDLSLGLAAKHFAINVVVGAGMLDLKRGTLAQAEAHDPVVMKLGLSFEYVFTKRNVLLQPYVNAGVDGLCLATDYRQDRISGGDRVRFDYLGGVGYHGSVGLALRPNQNFAVFGEMTAGSMEFANVTARELDNDLFNTFTYVGIRGGVKLMW